MIIPVPHSRAERKPQDGSFATKRKKKDAIPSYGTLYCMIPVSSSEPDNLNFRESMLSKTLGLCAVGGPRELDKSLFAEETWPIEPTTSAA
ncbi:unnamed protein product [Tuber melanosporum]|uniref:(Perigord truffle) hypothetical protein n=1 Tax=Tuber melanosporum (strain Mel28) TaxID=656061 RepID=D5G6B5_TUBMM|nr:uncharacterized protein GSTUM_00004407001 [Tuber melanosporum]CAZ80058.1 unnamed protein product [Tuber melanosporum]